MKSCTSIRAALTFATLLLLGPIRSAGLRAEDYAPFPNPDAGYVTDIAGLLSDDEEEQLERWLLKVEKDNGVEIIIVTIFSIRDYPGTPNTSIESFARGLFDAYAIGNMPQNDGVLLLVASRDRKARIELGAGYGHRRHEDASRIMNRRIVPKFRKDEYAEGLIAGVKGLVREFGGGRFLPGWLPWLLVAIIVGLIPVAMSLFRNGKRGWGWIVVGMIFVLVLVVVWLLRRAGEEGGFGAGGSGGLGGFGGGFSGGGGATGSW